MICKICQTERANVHLMRMAHGKMLRLELCDKCARARGLDDLTGFSLAHAVREFGSADEGR